MPSAAAAATPVDVGSAGPILLGVYTYFILIGNNIGLPILVATFTLSKTAKRHPILINLCLAWVFSGIYSLLLFYSGHNEGPEPPKTLCIAQTSLLYGTMSMWTIALFMLVLYMNISISGGNIRKSYQYLMLAAPYLAQLCFSIPTLIISILHPDDVTRRQRFFYCTLHNEPLATTMGACIILLFLATIILEARLLRIVYQHRRHLRSIRQSSATDRQVIFRVLVFTIYVVLGMIFAALAQFMPQNPISDIYASTIGMALLVIFGASPDVFEVWCFWRPLHDSSSSDSSSSEHTETRISSSRGFSSYSGTLAPTIKSDLDFVHKKLSFDEDAGHTVFTLYP